MASQDTRLSKFEADFKRQQGEMTNKIDTVLKAITDEIAGTLPSDTAKNPKLGTYPVLSARSYLIMDPQCSTQIHSSINAIIIHPKQPDESQVNKLEVKQKEDNPRDINSNPHLQPDPLASIATEQVQKLNSMLESLGLVPQSSNMKFVCSKEDDGEVMFIEIIRDDDEPQNEDPNEGEGVTTEEPYHTGQSESSSRSRPSRLSMPFPSYIHCEYNDYKSNNYVYYPICEICGKYDHDTHGHNMIISLRREIKPRNPQQITKNYETYGSNVHTTSDHNDIEWFRKREALQAKKDESFKASKTESSSALR
ncbi:hypothetical protein Tco_0842416 [Tanacetum coccineum]|uniref:Uncharacterized protein n=1 Tax=Tanacetum coccineum TaxID=301880 RepID=A0ABQ5B0X5_9ASTR